MHTISGDNTENVSEYNDKSVRESIENLNLNQIVTNGYFSTSTGIVKTPYFNIGVKHKWKPVMNMLGW